MITVVVGSCYLVISIHNSSIPEGKTMLEMLSIGFPKSALQENLPPSTVTAISLSVSGFPTFCISSSSLSALSIDSSFSGSCSKMSPSPNTLSARSVRALLTLSLSPVCDNVLFPTTLYKKLCYQNNDI